MRKSRRYIPEDHARQYWLNNHTRAKEANLSSEFITAYKHRRRNYNDSIMEASSQALNDIGYWDTLDPYKAKDPYTYIMSTLKEGSS